MKVKVPSWVFLVVAWSAFPAMASEWIHLRTPQFELYSTNSEAESRELVDLLSIVHWFVSTLSFVQGRMPGVTSFNPVRIIALSSKEEYAPFRLSATTFGYYRHSGRENYIVLQDIRPEHRQAATHEYVHFVLQQAGLALPLWLKEGLADLYSSLRMDRGKTRVGGLLPSHMGSVKKESQIDLEILFEVTSTSPFYKDPEKIPIFYAESWALVHMLAVSPDYEQNFPQFMVEMAKGIPAGTALFRVYGKSTAETQAALSAYLPTMSRFSTSERTTGTLALPVAPLSFSHEEIQSEALREEALGLYSHR